MCTTEAVIEYIHTATLLHDDVVDNADLRRSKKAARSIWGNEASVLVGDYLFTVSFQYLAEFEDPELIKILSAATTTMARGEIIQLARNNASANEDDYLKIIHYKTASLIGTAMLLGAKLAGADQEAISMLYDCGLNLGMAFQMIDDALDYDIKAAKTGKDTGTDIKERKITLPLSHLIEKSVKSDRKAVRAVLEKDLITDDDVKQVYLLMEKYGSIAYTLNRAQQYSAAAKSSLVKLPDSIYRTSISQLSDFIISRKT
jgi:octaprenyl-diphosphate synthase